MLFYDFDSLCIRDYGTLKLVSLNKIIIEGKKIKYLILGTNLFVFYLSKNEIKINGKIKEVIFNE